MRRRPRSPRGLKRPSSIFSSCAGCAFCCGQGRAEGAGELGVRAAPSPPRPACPFFSKISAVVGLWATTPPVSTTSPVERSISATRLTTEAKAPRTRSASGSPRRRWERISVEAKTVQKLFSRTDLGGAARQPLELFELEVEPERDLLDEGAGAGRALAVHLEIDPACPLSSRRMILLS